MLTIKTKKIRILQLKNCNWLVRLFYCLKLVFAAKACTGLLQGQEKSGKIKKNDKSQVKIGVFEKSPEI